MSTTPHYSPEHGYLFSNDNSTMLNNNFDEQSNIVNSFLQQQQQLISSLSTRNHYYSHHHHHLYPDNFNMDDNQSLSIVYNSGLNNLDDESANNFIDSNLFDMDNFNVNSSIFSFINDYENLSSLPTVFQHNVHNGPMTNPVIETNAHQTIGQSDYDFETSFTSTEVARNDDMTNVSPFMVITAIPMDCPYPPNSMFGSIADHDRPYAEYGHLNHQTIQRQCRFDLMGTKTATKRYSNNNRMSRKMYAIICRTNMAKESIMDEICQQQFPKPFLQYVCVSTDNDQSTTTYIQIILKKIVNKIGWFLDQVTGDQCNYHVTDNDLAWNEYIKKDRRFIEIGLFKSMRARSQFCSWSSSAFVRAQTNNHLHQSSPSRFQ